MKKKPPCRKHRPNNRTPYLVEVHHRESEPPAVLLQLRLQGCQGGYYQSDGACKLQGMYEGWIKKKSCNEKLSFMFFLGFVPRHQVFTSYWRKFSIQIKRNWNTWDTHLWAGREQFPGWLQTSPNLRLSIIKLDGVGTNNNRPSTN